MPFAPAGTWANPVMLVARVENLEVYLISEWSGLLGQMASTYWKPWSNSMFRVSLQFLRQSEAFVRGPVSTMYCEKVISMSVFVASIWTSAVPGGQPEPRSEMPLTRA